MIQVKFCNFLYVQDLVKHIFDIINDLPDKENPVTLGPLHEISLEDLALTLKEFKKGNLTDFPIGLDIPLGKALRETYQSYVT